MSTDLKSAVFLREEELQNYCNKLSSLLLSVSEFKIIILFVSGIMGSGKTTFCQKLIKSMTKDVEAIQSPTFNLENRYRVGDILIHHLDLYRTDFDVDLFYDIFLSDNKRHIYLIEWGDYLIKELNNPSTGLGKSLRDSAKIFSLDIRKLEDSREYMFREGY